MSYFTRLCMFLLMVFLIVGCASTDGTESGTGAPIDSSGLYTLQLLHFADVDGNEVTALNAVENLSALVKSFSNEGEYANSTLVVSSGDNIIPGPRFYAAEQSLVRSTTGSNEPGHADIAFLNALGVRASALGNHELDAGPGEFADALSSEESNGVVFPGALFPYLSANVDFSTEGDTVDLIGENGASVDDLQGKFAASAVVEINGERIGLVGATTPLLPRITTTGGLTVYPQNPNWTIPELAAEIQPHVDALIDTGINKVILLAHMQQITVEKELARELRGVDIIVAGGSNTRMGDATDTLYPGDSAFAETYPYATTSADEEPLLVVNVDADYKYLGRLVVQFDPTGRIVLDQLNPDINGAWASTAENVAARSATPIEEIVAIRQAIGEVIANQFGNVLGFTSVYLDGRRSSVRTTSTNLGNLSADANLWYANLMSSSTVHVSLKNGGGIRTEIGSAIVPPGSTDYSEAVFSAPVANPDTGTPEGAISEGHLRATFRFDNGLVLLDVLACELVTLIEHGISATDPRPANGSESVSTPGQFPQIGGMKLVFDATRPAGERIRTLTITGPNNSMNEVIVRNGQMIGDPNRKFKLVTLNFLANGGDSYPFADLSRPNRMNLYEGAGFGEEVDYPDANLSRDPGANSSFSYTGGEQDAFAEYLAKFHPNAANAFAGTDQPKRIQY